MGTNVQVEINRAATGGTFTNHDVIEGQVRLTTTTSLSLAYIEVKLEGIATTQLTIPKLTKRKERREKMVQDVHRVLYDTSIVFPPENVRLVALSKEFTLTAGNYTYPFLFKLPLHNLCVKMRGISNMVLFNKKSFDVVLNNGNFNSTVLRNAANNLVLQHLLPGAHQQQQYSQHAQLEQQRYHVHTQLPPTLNSMGDMANVRYFVKVTCKRSSILKANMRAFDPFVFLPLDLDTHNRPIIEGQHEEYKEVFFRKDITFKDRLPEVVAVKIPSESKTLPLTPPPVRKGVFLSFFGSPATAPPPKQSRRPSGVEVTTSTVPFSFEVRFRHPSFLVPTAPPTFKLFFVSDENPARYSLAKYGKPEESNGLGIVYLQKLNIELRSTTLISVLEADGATNEIHQSRADEVIPLCSNTYQNLQFDLMNGKRQKSSSATSSGFVGANSYELEIPRKYFDNAVLPSKVAPTFHTCNIQRNYSLVIVAGVSSERVSDFTNRAELDKKIRYVDLNCPDVKVVSGLKLTSTLHSNASGSSVGHEKRPVEPARPPEKSRVEEPRLPQRPPVQAVPSGQPAEESRLPTYDDVVRENSYQEDGEHLRARRRYQG